MNDALRKHLIHPQIHAGKLQRKDVAELVIGSVVLAFPVAITEEVWTLSEELSILRMTWIVAGSLFFLGGFIYTRYFHLDIQGNVGTFLNRVLWSYIVTLVVCALILIAIDRLETLEQPLIALKRTILVAFPATFSATVVDSLN